MPIFNGGRIGSNNVPFTGTKSNDPNYSNVSLLLNGNGTNGSTTFTDSSSYGHTVTPVGNAQISTAQSKFGGASIYLDGSGDCLSLPDDESAFNFGTGDFTIECWIYWVGGAYGTVFSQRHDLTTENTGMSWRIDDPTDVILFFHGKASEGSDYFYTRNNVISKNTWTHIALTRNGNTFTIWVNGQSEATNTSAISMIYHAPVIGRTQGSASEYLNAYLDDFRITKGVAIYTSNFTPPAIELPDPSDPDFSSVSLLLHGDGNNGSTTFIDSSSNSHTVTPAGNAQISTTQSKFGGSSMYFDGSGDYLTVTDSSLAFGTGEFTIEFWMRAASTAEFEGLLSTGNVNTTDSWQISGGADLVFSRLGGLAVGDTFPSLNTWHHVAIVRDASSVVTMYINGTNVDSATDTNDYSANNLKIGTNRAVNSFYDGYIDDLRITKGVARYTSNFTPPTAPLAEGIPPIVTDGLVLHLDAGDSASYPGTGTTWFDLTTNSNDGTITGATYSSNEGGYFDFDGAGDYVDISSFTFNSSSVYSVSFWFKPSSNTTQQYLFDLRASDSDNKASLIAYNQSGTSGKIHYTVYGSSSTTWPSAPTILSLSTWYHITVIHNSSTNNLKIYLNSTLDLDSSFGTDLTVSSTPLRIGARRSTQSNPTNGSISQATIYNRALTASEVQRNYNALKNRYGL